MYLPILQSINSFSYAVTISSPCSVITKFLVVNAVFLQVPVCHSEQVFYLRVIQLERSYGHSANLDYDIYLFTDS